MMRRTSRRQLLAGLGASAAGATLLTNATSPADASEATEVTASPSTGMLRPIGPQAFTPATPSSGLGPYRLSFSQQNVIRGPSTSNNLSNHTTPKDGWVWELRRVFWNVNADGAVASGVQTYLYQLPSQWSPEHAADHMAVSLKGWQGCLDNQQLGGNGDYRFGGNELVINPGETLWVYFLSLQNLGGWTAATGMVVDVWEEQHYAALTQAGTVS